MTDNLKADYSTVGKLLSENNTLQKQIKKLMHALMISAGLITLLLIIILLCSAFLLSGSGVVGRAIYHSICT